MKLAIVGWRPWTVVQRYKSLMVNAQRLGHQVFGLALDHFGDGPTTASLFRSLRVPVAEGHRDVLWQALERFRPNAVFGECFWGQESMAVDWARNRNQAYFALDHNKLDPVMEKTYGGRPSSMIKFLAANETNAASLTRLFGTWAVPVGLPNLDVEYIVNIDKVRRDLGVSDQPMVAVFLSYATIWDEVENRLYPLLELAAKRGWKIFMHIGAEEQHRKFKYLDRGHPRRALLKDLQDRGAVFVSCFSGNYNDVIFKPCGPMALVRCADLVCGTYELAFQAYAAGKKFFWVGAGEPVRVYPNLVKVGADFQELTEAIDGGIEFTRQVQDDTYVRGVFYKLDGRCWQRILAAAGV